MEALNQSIKDSCILSIVFVTFSAHPHPAGYAAEKQHYSTFFNDLSNGKMKAQSLSRRNLRLIQRLHY